MPDPFNSSKRRIERAKTHIHDLDGKINYFFKRKPCSHAVELDSAGVNHLHKIKFTATIPDSFGEIAADAIENLRSALDQAGYAVAVAAGTVNPRSAYFPIGENAANLDTIIAGRCKNIPDDITSLFREFKPYKGGNDLIWALNKANNINKHRLLVPSCLSPGSLNISINGTGDSRVPVPVWDSRKNEIVYAISGPGTKAKYDVNLSVCISFDEIETISGEPAATILRAMASEVERVVMAIESEARRLGFVP